MSNLFFLDTEFLEGTQTKRFLGIPYGTTKPTIDLISIGIVSEEGKEYYAISKDFNLKEAWNRYDLKPDINNGGMKKVYWIRENVLLPIYDELFTKWCNDTKSLTGDEFMYFTYGTLKKLINKYGKTNKQIAEDIKSIFTADKFKHEGTYPNTYPKGVKFYGYYSDYDWVAFCWLFGKMIQLPKGFPMYCIDLKQMLDEKENSLKNKNGKIELVSKVIPEHGCAMSAEFNSIKEFGSYPVNENEHNALADARWNLKLYKFILSLQ